MKRLIIITLFFLSTLAAQKWVIEPSIPDYSKRGMEAGSIMNPYEAQIRGDKIEISTPFQDSSKPSLSPGQPLNPLEIRPVR